MVVLFYHSGIQEELLYIQNMNKYGKSEGNNTAIITILPTTNILHFNYKTDLKYIPKGPAPTRPLPQIPNKSVQKSIFVRNDTNNTITLRITTEDDGQLAPKQIGSQNFIPLELYDGIVFTTALVE